MSEMLEMNSPRVSELVCEINQIKKQVRGAVVKGAVEIGRRLKEAKSLVPYGQWEKWLEENVSCSARTAQNMMRIADEYGKQETQALSELSITQAVLLLGVPAMEREAFVESHDLDGMSTRELQAAIDALKDEKARMQLTIDELMGEKAQTAAQSEEAAEELSRRIQELEADAKDHDLDLEALERALKAARANETALKGEKAEADRREEAAKAKAREAEENAKRMAEKLKAAQEELEKARNAVRTVEVVPEAVEQELARLRKQTARTGAESEMRAAFDGFKAAFDRLMEKLEDAQAEDKETADRFRAAFYKATMTMAGRMQ